MSGFHHPLSRLFPCNSGQPPRELVVLEARHWHDGHGIFCAFVCDACEAENRREFDPRIFGGPYDADEVMPEPCCARGEEDEQ